MSNTDNTPLTFLQQYNKVISETIAKSQVSYTNEPLSGKTGHHYYVDGKDAHVSTLKVVDPTHIAKPKYMLSIEIKQNGETTTYKCSGHDAKRIHDELYSKYDTALQRTRLKKKFQNPSFANHIKGC